MDPRSTDDDENAPFNRTFAGPKANWGRVEPFGPLVKASDDFLGPVFESYFGKLKLPNLMQKTDYHTLVQFVPEERIDPEIADKLDRIVAVAALAKPSA